MPIHLAFAAVMALASPAAAPSGGTADEAAALAAMNEAQLRAYVLEKDGASVDRIAHPGFRAIIAPGLIEDRRMVRDGVGNLAVDRFDVTTRSVEIVGDSAVIVTTTEASGTVMGRPFPPRVAMMHVYTRVDGAWRLLGRSTTPIQVPPEAYEGMIAPALRDR